jgi:MFS family permease
VNKRNDSPSSVSAPHPESTWSALRHPVYRNIWIATIASNIGTWMQDVANAWMMTSLSPSPLFVSMVQAANSLPLFLLALPAGALADIVDRRRMLIASQLWMLAAAASLGLLTLVGWVGPGTLLVFAGLIGIGSALAAPAFQAIVPELVPREDLSAAIGLNALAINISRSIGPALGGLVVAAAGPGIAFLLNAASFLCVAGVIFHWHREAQRSTLPAERLIGAMRAGLRYVRHSDALRAVLVRNGAFMAGASGLWALLPIVVRSEMHLGPLGYGLLLGCLGLGAFIAVNLQPRIRKMASPDSLVVIATLCFAIATLALAFLRQPFVLVPFLCVGGAGWVMALGALNVAAQRAVPPWARSRALSAYLVVWFGMSTAGSIVWGVIATRYGTGMALSVAALVLAAGALTILRYRLASADAVDLSPSGHWVEPQVTTAIEHDHGPVLVQVEYRVPEGNVSLFVVAMRPVRSERLRDGAVNWSMFRDLQDPSRFIEQFVVESWLEHLRQHERVSRQDEVNQQTVRSLLEDPSTGLVVIHAVAVDTCGSRSIAAATSQEQLLSIAITK